MADITPERLARMLQRATQREREHHPTTIGYEMGRDVLDLLAALDDARARAEKAEANYRFMVERAADQKLDGYRELGARAAAAEAERDALRAEVNASRQALAVFNRDGGQHAARVGFEQAWKDATSAHYAQGLALDGATMQASERADLIADLRAQVARLEGRRAVVCPDCLHDGHCVRAGCATCGGTGAILAPKEAPPKCRECDGHGFQALDDGIEWLPPWPRGRTDGVRLREDYESTQDCPACRGAAPVVEASKPLRCGCYECNGDDQCEAVATVTKDETPMCEACAGPPWEWRYEPDVNGRSVVDLTCMKLPAGCIAFAEGEDAEEARASVALDGETQCVDPPAEALAVCALCDQPMETDGGHGLGECVEVCEACGGSGDVFDRTDDYAGTRICGFCCATGGVPRKTPEGEETKR